MILTGTLAFFARSIAYALGLSVIRAAHSAGIFPVWMASITAWKFDPLPDASTAIRFFIVLSYENARHACLVHSGLFIYGRRVNDTLGFHDPPTMHLHHDQGDLSLVDLHFLTGVQGAMSKP